MDKSNTKNELKIGAKNHPKTKPKRLKIRQAKI
jgi:hypothetical protein